MPYSKARNLLYERDMSRSSRPGRRVARTRPVPKPVPIPSIMAPQLATLADAAPVGSNWSYEIKYDGYRLLARISGGGCASSPTMA